MDILGCQFRGASQLPRTKFWFVMLAALTTASAFAQTAKLLDAPVVKSELQVRWNDGAKNMQWQADGRQPYRAVQADSIFLTKRSIFVTYYQMNPLRVQATATATAADDPSYAVITKLIDALTSVATTVGPALPASAPGAPLPAAPATVLPTCGNPAGDFNSLYLLLYGKDEQPDELARRVKSWIDAIDTVFASGKSGPDAIAAGIVAIRRDANYYALVVKNSTDAWNRIKDCATSAPTDQLKALYAAASLTDINNRISQISAA